MVPVRSSRICIRRASQICIRKRGSGSASHRSGSVSRSSWYSGTIRQDEIEICELNELVIFKSSLMIAKLKRVGEEIYFFERMPIQCGLYILNIT